VSNNNLYIKAIKNNKMFFEKEKLSIVDQYNEYIMTGLRTIWGISLKYLKDNFGIKYRNHFINKSQKFIVSNHLILNDDIVKTTIKGKFLSDGIASELFLINF
jgi:oxygen-independent coproporphyrinogen-3 oxidase